MIAREPDAPPSPSVRAPVAFIGAGLFATGLAWPGLIAWLPLSLLLKNQLGLPPQQVATFWAVATAPFYFKPLAGLIVDAYPLFGTRRRGYLIAGSVAAGLLWLSFLFLFVAGRAASRPSFLTLLALTTALNVPLVFCSTALGGILVELGQRHGITGRLSSTRMAAVGAMSLVAGPLGGYLASRAFGWTAGAGAAILLGFATVAAFLYREPRAAGAGTDAGARGADQAARALATARRGLGAIARSRAMWTTAGLIFLVYLAPGFRTPLLYYQQGTLAFDAGYMGTLQLIGAAGAIAGAAAYAALCRRIALGPLLVAGIILNAGSILLYLGYDSRASAAAITGAAAFFGTIATLPLFDLAARATPKGAESLGYALLLSVESVAQFAVSEKLGSALYGGLHVGWKGLVWINAGSTAAVLLFTPLLPRALLATAEGARARERTR